MQVNPLSSSQTSNSTNQGSSTNRNSTTVVAATRLTTGSAGTSKTVGKPTTAPPMSKGFFELIKDFFNRRMSPTNEEEGQAKEVKVAIGRVEQPLNQLKREKLNSSDGFTQANKKLKEVQNGLVELKSKEELAKDLADKRTAFDHLPGEIQKLEKAVHHFKGKLAIAEKLYHLENAITDYSSNETWEKFEKIKQEKDNLISTLKDVIQQNPAVKENPKAQAYLQKRQWNDPHVYQLLTFTFPELKSQVDRLWSSTFTIEKKRIEKLEQQSGNLKVLILKYSKQSKQISDLENAIYGNSLSNRISRAYHGKPELKKKLEKAMTEQKETFKAITREKNFNPTELHWLEKTVNKVDPNKKGLKKEIETLDSTTSRIEKRESIAKHMNTLLSNLRTLKHNSPHLKTKELQEALKSNIIQLGQEVQDWQFKLPRNFSKMDLVDQLKTLISTSFFPSLDQRNQRIFNLIKEKNLHEQFTNLSSSPIDLDSDTSSFVDTATSTSFVDTATSNRKEQSEKTEAEAKTKSAIEPKENIVDQSPQQPTLSPIPQPLPTSTPPPPPPPPPSVLNIRATSIKGKSRSTSMTVAKTENLQDQIRNFDSKASLTSSRFARSGIKKDILEQPQTLEDTFRKALDSFRPSFEGNDEQNDDTWSDEEQ